METMFKKLSAVAILLGVLTLTPMMIGARTSAPAQEKKAAAREQHPHIRAALMELREAKRELETAAHDFGGHRKEALEAVDNAIKQLQLAQQYDKK
jgi:hypothetical protein